MCLQQERSWGFGIANTQIIVDCVKIQRLLICAVAQTCSMLVAEPLIRRSLDMYPDRTESKRALRKTYRVCAAYACLAPCLNVLMHGSAGHHRGMVQREKSLEQSKEKSLQRKNRYSTQQRYSVYTQSTTVGDVLKGALKSLGNRTRKRVMLLI